MESVSVPLLIDYLNDNSIIGKIVFGRKIRKEKETYSVSEIF